VTSQKLIGSIPKLMGSIPKAIGSIPKAIGSIPKLMGSIPSPCNVAVATHELEINESLIFD
jgi:hypothetical protein